MSVTNYLTSVLSSPVRKTGGEVYVNKTTCYYVHLETVSGKKATVEINLLV